jgi:ABC-type multidrug transport system fused ATPase/permease subunit
VHLIPAPDEEEEATEEEVNVNIFKNLDSPVSEGGENFSAGEKQLIWYVIQDVLQNMAG